MTTYRNTEAGLAERERRLNRAGAIGKIPAGVALSRPKKRAKSQPDKPARPSEHQEQCAFFAWVRMYLKTKGIEPSLCYAVPNGGARHKAVAAKLKAEGVTAGVCDVNFDYPHWGAHYPLYHGLKLEFKRAPNKLTAAQDAHIAALRGVGYNVVVCWSFEEAKRTIEAYLA